MLQSMTIPGYARAIKLMLLGLSLMLLIASESLFAQPVEQTQRSSGLNKEELIEEVIQLKHLDVQKIDELKLRQLGTLGEPGAIVVDTDNYLLTVRGKRGDVEKLKIILGSLGWSDKIIAVNFYIVSAPVGWWNTFVANRVQENALIHYPIIALKAEETKLLLDELNNRSHEVLDVVAKADTITASGVWMKIEQQLILKSKENELTALVQPDKKWVIETVVASKIVADNQLWFSVSAKAWMEASPDLKAREGGRIPNVPGDFVIDDIFISSTLPQVLVEEGGAALLFGFYVPTERGYDLLKPSLQASAQNRAAAFIYSYSFSKLKKHKEFINEYIIISVPQILDNNL